MPAPVTPQQLRLHGQRYVRATTGQELADTMRTALGPMFREQSLVIKYTENIAPSLWIFYASCPPGSPEIEWWNAKVHYKIGVFPVPSSRAPWTPAPAKAKAEATIANPRTLFRAKSGTPQQVVDYIIRFFKSNEQLLKARSA